MNFIESLECGKCAIQGLKGEHGWGKNQGVASALISIVNEAYITAVQKSSGIGFDFTVSKKSPGKIMLYGVFQIIEVNVTL
jgi:hypothetical protein